MPFAFYLLPSLALAQAQPRINTPKDDPAAAAADTTGRFSLTVYSTADPATFDPQRDAGVCGRHALHVSKRERAAVEAMEKDDGSARTHYLIGRRAE